METTAVAIKRKMDNLGRFVIPKDMRDLLGINMDDTLSVTTDGKCVIITPQTPRCPLCGSKRHKDKMLCDECIMLIKESQ